MMEKRKLFLQGTRDGDDGVASGRKTSLVNDKGDWRCAVDSRSRKLDPRRRNNITPQTRAEENQIQPNASTQTHSS